MKTGLTNVLGLVILFIPLIYFLAGHGKRWEFGACCMPSTLLSEDGLRYRDGSRLDPVTRSIALSGNEQDVWLGITALLAVLGSVCAYQLHGLWRSEVELQKWRELLRQEIERPSSDRRV